MDQKKLKKAGIRYSGSGSDPAVNNVIKKLMKDGTDSINYRWQDHMQVNVDDKDRKRRNRLT